MHETRVATGVEELEQHGEEYGIHFTDARLSAKDGDSIGLHLTPEFLEPVPQGMIFKEILSRYFINPVSMMMTDKMLKILGGYDEELAYEDFDLWVRLEK